MSEQTAPAEQEHDPNELVTIARTGTGTDGGPGPTATCTREAYDQLYRERGYGLVTTTGKDAGTWAEEPLPEEDAPAGSPSASGAVSTTKGA